MEYSKANNTYIVRLDKNEEVLSSIKKFCEHHDITLGTVTAIGSINRAIIGLFDPIFKKYYTKEFRGPFEITSLTGNVSNLNDECFPHLHITFSDTEYHVFGGHLEEGVVSTTCEIFITAFEGDVTRKFNDEIGLNLYQFPQ